MDNLNNAKVWLWGGSYNFRNLIKGSYPWGNFQDLIKWSYPWGFINPEDQLNESKIVGSNKMPLTTFCNINQIMLAKHKRVLTNVRGAPCPTAANPNSERPSDVDNYRPLHDDCIQCMNNPTCSKNVCHEKGN